MGSLMAVGEPSCRGQLLMVERYARRRSSRAPADVCCCSMRPSSSMVAEAEQCSEVWYWAAMRLPDERTQRLGPRNSNKRSPFISPQSPCTWPPKLGRACSREKKISTFYRYLCDVLIGKKSLYSYWYTHCSGVNLTTHTHTHTANRNPLRVNLAIR